MVEKRIHFVCRGNTFRSRIAEAYAKSLKHKGYAITSSGVDIRHIKDVLVSPYAQTIARQHHFVPFMSKNKTQTTAKILGRQDIIVFFGKDVFDEALTNFGLDARQAVVWDIDDLVAFLAKHPRASRTASNYTKITNHIGAQIIRKVDELFNDLEGTSWSDIYDANNKALGYRLPVSWATARKGLWRRSVHAVVTTANGKYVVEKRSDKIIFAPGMLDVSLGGGVDSHETPRQAVIRELQEELGVKVRPDQLTHLTTRKWGRYHPHYKRYTNMFLYTYHVKLTLDDPIFVLQPSEVKEVRLLSHRQVKRLLSKHRYKHFGPLNYGYKYYADVVKRAKIYVK